MSIKRKCYECGTQLSYAAARTGQRALAKAAANEWFEGWVDCKGTPEMFVQPLDGEMGKCYAQGIIVCFECVRNQLEEERLEQERSL